MKSRSRAIQKNNGDVGQTELPPKIIRRIPVWYVYDNNYFDDSYQGIPVVGYTEIIKKMLKKQM